MPTLETKLFKRMAGDASVTKTNERLAGPFPWRAVSYSLPRFSSHFFRPRRWRSICRSPGGSTSMVYLVIYDG